MRSLSSRRSSGVGRWLDFARRREQTSLAGPSPAHCAKTECDSKQHERGDKPRLAETVVAGVDEPEAEDQDKYSAQPDEQHAGAGEAKQERDVVGVITPPRRRVSDASNDDPRDEHGRAE